MRKNPAGALYVYHMQESIPTSLLKLSADNSSRAVKMFAGIQRYMDEAQEGSNTAQSIEIVQKLLHQGLKRPELKDELFMQLLKQSRGNPSPAAAGKHQPEYSEGVRPVSADPCKHDMTAFCTPPNSA